MKYTRESFAIYYADGTKYTNEDGPPERAPKTGVLAVAHFNLDNRREIATSKDFYWYEPDPIFKDEKGGTFYGGDIAGFYQYMFRPGWRCVYFGVIVHDVIWRREIAKITSEFPEALDYRVKLPEAII